MSSIKVLQFFPHTLSARKGGPYTYLFNLKTEVRDDADVDIDFLSDLVPFNDDDTAVQKQTSIVKSIITKIIPAKWVYDRRILQYLETAKNDIAPGIENIDLNSYHIVHFHESIDLWRFQHLLKNYKGKIVFTSHSPIPYHLETLEETFGLKKTDISSTVYNQLEETDRFAFSYAHHLVLPCKEAVEAYYQWAPFQGLIKNKPVDYVVTGIPSANAIVTKEETRKKLNIPSSAFVVSYTARHAGVKGFNLLEDAAEMIIDKYPDLYFIVAGNKKHTDRFHHARWIESGWTDDPYSLTHAANVHIIPNRVTYFDLNTLEAMSIGTPVILTETGGNKFFKQLNDTKGLFFCKPEAASIANAIEMCYSKREMLPAFGNENKTLFEKHFTASHFYNSFIELYKKLVQA